jgi:hypothetical protein
MSHMPIKHNGEIVKYVAECGGYEEEPGICTSYKGGGVLWRYRGVEMALEYTGVQAVGSHFYHVDDGPEVDRVRFHVADDVPVTLRLNPQVWWRDRISLNGAFVDTADSYFAGVPGFTINHPLPYRNVVIFQPPGSGEWITWLLSATAPTVPLKVTIKRL